LKILNKTTLAETKRGNRKGAFAHIWSAFNALASCCVKMVCVAVVAVFAVVGYVLPEWAALQIRHKHTSLNLQQLRHNKKAYW